LIQHYAGIDVHIEESSRPRALWSLSETSSLGFDTVLAPGYTQGAVLDTTATLDGTYLSNADAPGAPLFQDAAYHFYVWVYQADLKQPRVLEKVREILDREKPAHTVYHLCVVKPRFRVGLQARLGIDAIVAGPGPGLVLAGDQTLGIETVLSPKDGDVESVIDHQIRIGQRTRLA
jgi:hypothetical protein